MSFNALLENMNRRQQSYNLVGQPSGRPRIQRISPLNFAPSPIQIGPTVQPRLGMPQAQSLGMPQAQSLGMPQAQSLGAPAAQSAPTPVSPLLQQPQATDLNDQMGTVITSEDQMVKEPVEELEELTIEAEDKSDYDYASDPDVNLEDEAFAKKMEAAGPITKEAVEEIDKKGSKGFMGWLDGVMGDDEKFGHLLMGLNAMRGRPDQNIAALARDHIKRGAARKGMNRTVNALVQKGQMTEDEAQLVRSGMKIKDVIALRGKEKERKIREDVQGVARYVDTGELVFPGVEAPVDREDAKEEAERARLDKFIALHGPVEGALKYEEHQHQQALERERAGVPQPVVGQIKPEHISNVLTQVRQEVKPAKEGLSKVGLAKTLLSEVKGEDSAMAQNQLDRTMATLAGDKQLSMAEVRQIATAGSLPQRVMDTLSRWVSGTTTGFTQEEVGSVIEAMENYYGAGLNAQIDRLTKLYGGSMLPAETIEAAMPERYAPSGGAGGAPSGVDPQLWSVMTPEEKALW